MKRALLLVGLALAVAAACSTQTAGLDPLEQRAQALDKTLMCPICPGESIDQSQVELARQMRQVVREKLAEGWTEEQVRGFFVERYGPSVLMAPPQRGFSLVAWVAPPVAVATAVLALALVLWRLRQGRGSPVAGPAEALPEQEQQEYLRRAAALLEAEARQGGSDDDQGTKGKAPPSTYKERKWLT